MSRVKGIVSDVVAAASGHWPDVLAAVGIAVPPRGKHGPCPVCGGADRFRLDDKAGRGTWICNQCDPKSGDGLDLVCRVTGKDVKGAAELIAPLVGLSGSGLDPAERERLIQRQRENAEATRKQAEQQRKKAIRRAADIVRDTSQGQSPYLERKRLRWPAGALTSTLICVGDETFQPGALVVPLHNEVGDLVNVQMIQGDGTKRYLPGGQKADAFHCIAGGELVAVVEGYATGLSVHLATGATVYCAMDSGNLLAVAEIARRRHPEARILVCGDNDEAIKGNPGKVKAEQAAATVGAMVAIPPSAGDWNDYHQAHGITQTLEAITTSSHTPTTEHTKDAYQKEGPWTADKSRAKREPTAEGGTPWQAAAEPAGVSVDSADDSAPYLDMPEGFEVIDGHLCAWVLVGRGDDMHQERVPVASPVRVLADTSSERGQDWGRLLEWQDRKGRVRQWAMPMGALVVRGGDDVLTALLDGGLPFISVKHRRKLIEYLMACKPDRHVTCVTRTGWYEGVYVLPGEAIGPNAQEVALLSAGYAGSDFSERGTLADWQREIAALAMDNSRVCFGLSLAFAAPLLSLVGMEGGGFHLKGDSTDGKSTIMYAAASVYGPRSFKQSWRATGNAIEGIASRRHDALLCLDEIGEVDGREAGQVAYMLANGQGKGRSKQDGELRERRAWRLLFLSTGELSLEDHAASAGMRTQAGMEVRTTQIPSRTGYHGAFECLHGLPDGRTFADTLLTNTERYYGTAFRAYVTALAGDVNAHSERLMAELRRLADELTPEGAGNQVGRAINRFALVAAAGELATQLGVTGWPAGEATRAVKVCLKAWLDERGHLGNKEEAAMLAQVRRFVVANQFSRFADWFDPNHRPANVVGFRKVEADVVRFYVPMAGWLEITKGFDPKRTAQVCADADYLLTGKDKKRLQRKVRLPGMNGLAWAYVLDACVLADEAEGAEDV